MIRLASFVTAFSMLTVAHAADDLALSLATATPGGGFAVYGQALVEVLRDVDPGIRLEPRGTKGSRENLPLLAEGKVDLALVEGTIVQEVLEKGPAKFEVIAAMYSSPGMFAVRADSPYRAITDLRGKRIILGAAGSGLTQLGRLVIDGVGLDSERDFDVVLLQAVKDGPPQVLDGSAAAIWGAGLGWPGFMGVANGPKGARYFGPSEAEIETIRAKHPFLQRLVIPAGSFPRQAQDIPTVGTWSFILARPSLPDDAAYRLAKALHAAQPALGNKLAQAVETTPQNTLVSLPKKELLHPGVKRYLEEVGIR
jgi:TRAP transporter TAXI family solute receptor